MQKTNLTENTNSLNTNLYPISNLNSLNKNKQIKTTIEMENKNGFITENSVHFDNNVIIKKNSQFLPKIKNYVKRYKTELIKQNYWPAPTNEETNIILNSSFNLSFANNPIPIRGKEVVEQSHKTINPKGREGENLYPISLLEKKIKISKLNTNKKGSFINNKIISQLFEQENINSNSNSNTQKDWKNNLLNSLSAKKIQGLEKTIPLAHKGLSDSLTKNTIISQYMNTMSNNKNKLNIGPNLSKKHGTLLQYNKIISYKFLQNKQTVLNNLNPSLMTIRGEEVKIMNSEIIEETYKLLFIYFKSIYCLISKPVISITPDKVNIQLFYYLNIPKKKIIKLFAIHYLNSFKNKWLNNSPLVLQVPSADLMGGASLFENKENKFKSTLFSDANKGGRGNINSKKIRLPFINRKARKSISRFKSKSNYLKNIIFNLIKYNIAKVFSYKFKLICNLLSNKFNKPVELELIRLHNPYLDTNILVNLLHLIIKNKKKKPKNAIDKIYNKNQVKKLNDSNLISVNNKPAFLSGLNFYINGRTMGEAIVPRMTTKSFEKGATATGKVNFLDKSTITKKNKKGAYTIKVISAQNFF